MKLKHCWFLLLFWPIKNVYPQPGNNTLSADQVVLLVKKYHPVVKQADIGIEKARADVTIARGLFDPLLSVKSGDKTFDGTGYYRYTAPEITIPSWYGIEFSTGIQNLRGSRTDPRETLGQTSYAGASFQLLKNLVTDKRRAALQQSKIFRELSEVQKKSVLNDLLHEALYSYWNWVQQYNIKQVLNNAVAVNEKRFELVKASFRLGDRPAIDTTEALAQLQGFRYQFNEAALAFQNAGIDLSAYLWNTGNIPFELPEEVVPETNLQSLLVNDSLFPAQDELLSHAISLHPDLQQYHYKLDALKVEKKLKFQEILPSLTFRYNQLGKGYNLGKTITAPLLENNFQYGVSFSIPLRLSEGRGEYRKVKLKIQETSLQQKYKEVQVANKIRIYYNELVMLKKQLQLQQQQFQNYLTLQKGEETRFFNGESSLFLIISRENKALEARQKVAEMEAKYFKTLTSLKWAAGQLLN